MREPHPPWADSLVQKVFEIPELLEHILSFTEMTDILQMMQLCKATMSTIRGSSKLLHQLHLLPNTHSLLPIPPRFRTCHMFQVFIEGKVISFISQFDDQVFGTAPNPLKSSAPDTNSGRFHARFHTIESGCLPRVGDTAKAILLCQPPITEMSYSLNCCPRSSSTASIVRAPEGLTVGHLYNSTKELMRAHMLCPHAPAEFLDAQGYVKVEVTYTGKIKLRPDDPHLMGNDSAIQDFRKPLRSAWYFPENPEKLRAYTKVKQAAHAKGSYIPTLAEFEAVGGRLDALL